MSETSRSLRLVFDFGTTSVKVALATTHKILDHLETGYGVSTPHPGWAEQNPDDLWDTASDLSRELVARHNAHDAVDRVIFIAPWKGIVAVNTHGRVLHPAITWLEAGPLTRPRASIRSSTPPPHSAVKITSPKSCGSSRTILRSGTPHDGSWG